jgi:hypothetical protein
MGRLYLVLNDAKHRTRTGRSGSAPKEFRHIVDQKKERGVQHIGKSAYRVTQRTSDVDMGDGLISITGKAVNTQSAHLHTHNVYLYGIFRPQLLNGSCNYENATGATVA